MDDDGTSKRDLQNEPQGPETTSPNLAVAGHTERGMGRRAMEDRRGSARKQSPGRRWGNLPPELRAIKDRWLGKSSEEILPCNSITTASGMASSCAYGTKQPDNPLREEPRSGVIPSEKTTPCSHPDSLKEAPASHHEHEGERGRLGQMQDERTGKEQHRDEVEYCFRSRSLERNHQRGGAPRAVLDAVGHRLRNATGKAFNETAGNRNHRPLQQHSAHPVVKKEHRFGCDRRGNNAIHHQWGPTQRVKALRTLESRSHRNGGYLADWSVLGADQGFGEAVAPAIDDALGASLGDGVRGSRDNDRPRHVRSTTHVPCLKPSSRVQSPGEGRMKAEVNRAGEVGKGDRTRGRSRHKEPGDGSEARWGVKSTGEVSSATTVDDCTHRNMDVKMDVIEWPGGHPVEKFEDPRGERGRQAMSGDMIISTWDIEACCTGMGRGNSDETTSTRSPQSELFDSLDLSISVCNNNGGGRPDTFGVTVVPATARPVPATKKVTVKRTLLSEGEQNLSQTEPPQTAETDLVDVTTVAHTVGTLSLLNGAPVGSYPLIVSLDATVPIKKTRSTEASGGNLGKLLQPARTPKSPPMAPPRKVATELTQESISKWRERPGVPRLRDSNGRRDARVSSITPASTVAGLTKVNPFPGPAIRIRDGNARTTTAITPCDLLTPVAEAATTEEHSVASHGTGGTTRMTPASSVTSVSKQDEGEPTTMTQGERSPRDPTTNARHHASQGVSCLESLVVTSSSGCGRNPNGREKRGTWGSGTVPSGAHSAPCRSSATSKGRHSRSDGAMSSSSAYRSSPLSGTSERDVARDASLPHPSGGNKPGLRTKCGYMAAMARRARSMAKYEAARRLAIAAMKASRPRPPTPVSERVQWGKGKESNMEVERRKLLRRRAEYAEELQRKAKEASTALAERKRVRTISTLPPTDCNIRDCARNSVPAPFVYDAPHCDAVVPPGGLEGNIAPVIETNTACDTRSNVLIDYQASSPILLPCGSVCCPDPSQLGDNSSGRASNINGGISVGRAVGCGQSSVGRIREKLRTKSAPDHRSPGDEEEESRLVASIARLDTLLRKGSCDVDESHPPSEVANPPNLSSTLPSGTRTGSRGRTRDIDRKTSHVQVGLIGKSRTRGRGGKETRNCSPLPTLDPKHDLNNGMCVGKKVLTAAIDRAANGHGTTPQNHPGTFPPLLCQVHADTNKRGLGSNVTEVPDGLGENSFPRQVANHVTRRAGASDGQRLAGRRDDGYTDVEGKDRLCKSRRRAVPPSPWAGDSTDRYGNSVLAPPRYAVRKEHRGVQQHPRSPTHHREMRPNKDEQWLPHKDEQWIPHYRGDLRACRDRAGAIGSQRVCEM